jgi:hypothetical protein
MPIFVNGVEIDTASDAFVSNGVVISNVYFNGIEVYVQNQYSATWTGDTVGVASNGAASIGMNTSGSLFRSMEASYCNPLGNYGVWLTANLDGTFSGGTSKAASQYAFSSITANGTNVIQMYAGTVAPITWNVGTGTFDAVDTIFSTVSGYQGRVVTSNNTVRYYVRLIQTGSWGNCGTSSLA